MINLRTVLIIFQVAFCLSAHAQVKNAKIIYHVQLNLKKDTIKVANYEAMRFRQMMLDEVENLRPELLYNDKISMFHVPTPVFANKMQETFYKIAKTVTQLNQNYFCDLQNGNYKEHVFFGDEEYLINDNSDYKWELTNVEKTIAGHKCLKAKTTYSYKSRHGKQENLEVKAWYAPGIPLPLGPRNFSGLPGLILELSIADDVIVYFPTEVLLNSRKMQPVKLPKDVQTIDRKAYNKLVKTEYDLFFEKN